MTVRESLERLHRARRLSESGEHARLLEFLGQRPSEDLERSPTLALLYGVAHVWVGRNADGERWVSSALERARKCGDRTVEARALNVSGAICLNGGRLSEAAEFFTHALSEAKRAGDHQTIGHCSNNLGIIATMRGEFGRAVGCYTMALAAFQQVGLRAGIAQTLNNLAIAYRDQGELGRALEAAERAVEESEGAGDQRLGAATRGGRAEIRMLAGDAEVARREIERVLEIHRELGSVIDEMEDLRVWAGTLAATGETDEAESVLREVVSRALVHERPLLAAWAERDLAVLLCRWGRLGEGEELARSARVRFSELGMDAEVKKLDELLSQRALH